MSLAFKEGIKIPPPALNEIILASNQDVRQVKKTEYHKFTLRFLSLCLPSHRALCISFRWFTTWACGRPKTRWWRTTGARLTQPALARTWNWGRLMSAGRCLPPGRRRPIWASSTSPTSSSTTTRSRRSLSRRTTCMFGQRLPGERVHLFLPVSSL